jgi:hypothetical protein
MNFITIMLIYMLIVIVLLTVKMVSQLDYEVNCQLIFRNLINLKHLHLDLNELFDDTISEIIPIFPKLM